ncbi:hypothetical protein ACFS2C_24715 [Prauserella oleivorans]|uniref:Uncharacterized protein n=1 Tax=Prauserella oleivorans TaxID=1478153 RepID=A0ABW5WHP1_9PSEU
MDIALYIVGGLVALLVVAVLVVAGIGVIGQLRTQMEQRYEQVRQKLRESETSSGATSILSGHLIGVDDDKVRELAREIGYEWTGYSGRNDRRLNFQRRLSKFQ